MASTDDPAVPDILLSGMPCQDYSGLGSLHGSSGNTGYMFIKQADVILKLQPSAAILEMTGNVINFVNDLRSLTDKLRATYVVHHQLVSCWRYGDCSTRVRLFMVLLHKRLGPEVALYEFPPPVYDHMRHHCEAYLNRINVTEAIFDKFIHL